MASYKGMLYDVEATHLKQIFLRKDKTRESNVITPEIVDVFELEEHCFGIVGLNIKTEVQYLQFGITKDAFHLLRKILQSRPFDQMPGLVHRYFFIGASTSSEDSPLYSVKIRIEQGGRIKNSEFQCPKDLACNLQWFLKLENFEQASHLPRIPLC